MIVVTGVEVIVLSQLMDIFLPTVSAVIIAGASYLFAKFREREAELRKEKLAHYKEFVASLSGILEGEDSAEGHRRYALARNNLNLIAPQAVLLALHALSEEIKTSNSQRSHEAHDNLLAKLFYEIRKDLRISPAESKGSFLIKLWGSGLRSEGAGEELLSTATDCPASCEQPNGVSTSANNKSTVSVSDVGAVVAIIGAGFLLNRFLFFTVEASHKINLDEANVLLLSLECSINALVIAIPACFSAFYVSLFYRYEFFEKAKQWIVKLLREVNRFWNLAGFILFIALVLWLMDIYPVMAFSVLISLFGVVYILINKMSKMAVFSAFYMLLSTFVCFLTLLFHYPPS